MTDQKKKFLKYKKNYRDFRLGVGYGVEDLCVILAAKYWLVKAGSQ